MKRSFADILQDLDDTQARRLARKLPEWAAVGAEVPSALSLEQCSSSATAGYKASLAGRTLSDIVTPCTPSRGMAGYSLSRTGIHQGTTALREEGPEQAVPGRTVLDLTGGLGVDSWAFSQVAERVVYFEREAALAEAAERNFVRLGVSNIEVRCETVTAETELPEADLIYADPARRDAAGRKVFLLEDCSPDILTLLPMLLQKAPAVLLKVSPMADLAMLADRLGPALRELHVVELDGEVKEILCLISSLQAAPAAPTVVIVRLSGTGGAAGRPVAARGLVSGRDTRREAWEARAKRRSAAAAACPESRLRFQLSEEREAPVRYAAEVRQGDVLLEPCPALLKAGAFRLPCARWGLLKLAPSTHLYLFPTEPGTETPHFVPGEQNNGVPGTDIAPDVPGNRFFKARRVREVLPLGAAAFKELRKRYPRADVSARNLPLNSEALQKKLGIPPGGDTHIFGCRLADGSAVLIVTEA